LDTIYSINLNVSFEMVDGIFQLPLFLADYPQVMH